MTTVEKTTKTQPSKKVQSKVEVLEVIRRQGVYTTNLQVESVEEIKAILDSFEGRRIEEEGYVARQGSRVPEIEFAIQGGRKGRKEYCFRLPETIKLEDLQKIGFEKNGKANIYIK